MNALIDRLRSHDRTLLVCGGALLLVGFLYALTSSPGAAARAGFDSSFAFGLRHGAFALAAALVGLGAAFLPAVAVRRVGVLLLLLTLALMAAVLVLGAETKGAQRWLSIAGMSLQPSEFAKPALVVAMAWMLAAARTQDGFPGVPIAIGLYAIVAALLVLQPDFGQTALLGVTLAGMLYASGASWRLFAGLGAACMAFGWGAYTFVPHVRARVDDFLDPTREGFQVGRAFDAIASGGVFGRGPGEGIVKASLPDAHADFVYAAAAEEFGWMASIGIVALYGLIAWYGLRHATRLRDPFQQLAAAGLVLLVCVQAAIHIAVNVGLAPAKGMTLPLVSYGGSALLGSALTLGFALALLRNAPQGAARTSP